MTVNTAKLDRVSPLQRKEPMLYYTTTSKEDARKSRCCNSNILFDNANKANNIILRTMQRSKSVVNLTSDRDINLLQMHRQTLPSTFGNDQYILDLPQFEKIPSLHDLLQDSNVSCLTESWVGEDHDDYDLECFDYEGTGLDSTPIAPRRESTRSCVGLEKEEFGFFDLPPKCPKRRSTKQSLRSSYSSRTESRPPHFPKRRSTKQSVQSAITGTSTAQSDQNEANPPRRPMRRSTKSAKQLPPLIIPCEDADTDDDDVICKQFEELFLVRGQGWQLKSSPIDRRRSV